MSPSWRECWLVSLAPRRLGVLRFAPGLQPRLRDGAAHDYESEPGAPVWAAGVRLLGGLLEGAARPVSLSVVLSNHFVRYAVVPWTEGVRGESQRLAVARAQFLGLFGAEAAAWAAALEPARHGQPAMAAAVDAGLLDSLCAHWRRGGAACACARCSRIWRRRSMPAGAPWRREIPWPWRSPGA